MKSIYIIIYLPQGYMIADLSKLGELEQDRYISSITPNHPVAVIDVNNSSDIKLYYKDQVIDVPDIQDATDVLEVTTKVISNESNPEIFKSYNNKDLSSMYIEFNSDLLDSQKILEEPLEPIEPIEPIELQDNVMKTIIDDIESLRQQVEQLSNHVLRLTTQYGLLREP